MPDTERLLNAIEQAEAESYGSGTDGSDGTLSDDRAAAIDAYFGRNTFPAPEGNSQVISRDLFDTVEWIIPSLTRIFAGTDEVVKIEPIGPDDVKQAEQESMYVNHVVTQKNQWEQTSHDWFWDALVTKNAYCMAYWDDSKEVEYERYENQTEDALRLLLEDDGIEVLEHSAEVDQKSTEEAQQAYAMAMQQWQMMAMQAQQTGQMPPPPPTEPQPIMLHAIKIRRTRDNGKACLRVLPPERCLIHQATPDYTLKDCDFFEYWEETTISKLRAMGFQVDDDIDADERGFSATQEDQARDLYSEDATRGESWEPSMRKVRARMCWIRQDYDEDGIAELQYVLVVGRHILYREECNRIPVGSIVATPVPHRHIGLSISDVVIDIQETKTQILRQGIDNLYHANNPRTFLNEGKIDLDDALVSRPGGVIRGKAGENAVFGQDIGVITVPNVFPQAVQGMEYMDQVKQGRVGVNNYFTGTDENALNKTARGISQLTSSAAQRVEQIARMISPSVEYLFSCVHELILKHGHKKEVVRLKGEWVPVDPANWVKKRDLKIAVGLGSGSRDSMLMHLEQIFAKQMATLPMGLTEPNLIYNTLAEITKAAGFATEAQFWKKAPPPQPHQPPIEVMLEKMKQQHEAGQNEADRKLEAWQTQTAEGNKRDIAELQSNTQQLIAMMKSYMDEQKQAMEAQLETLRLAQERSNMELGFVAKQADKQPVNVNVGADETKKQMAELADAIGQALGTLHQTMQGSQTVGIERVRDKAGKLVGGRIKLADGSTRDVQIQ